MIGLKAIKPNQSIEIDVKKLRDDQTPDKQGRIIPLNITNGQLQWALRRKDNLPEDDLRGTFALIGRSEQIDFVKNTSSNYACQNCCGLLTSEGFLFPNNNVQITQGLTQQFEAYESGITCYGFFYTYQINPNSWSSSNTNAATVSQVGVATGVNAGTTNIRANWRSVRTREGNPCPTGGGPLFVGCNEGIDQTFKKALAEKGKEEDETIPTRLPCGACTTYYANLSANTNVTVVEPDFTITVPPTAKDGSTVTFSSTITRGTPVSYEWSFTSPTGAGNNPQVNFASASSPTTTAQAHWFALPNQPCATSTLPSDSYFNSEYKIKLKITFNGGKVVEKESSFQVNNYWNPSGYVQPPNLEGYPAIQTNSQGQWFVSGPGILVRKTYAKLIYVPSNSQFYFKTTKHEEKHEQQVASGIASQLWLVSDYMSVISGFTDSTEAGLRTQLNNASLAWDNTQLTDWNRLRPRAEREAYAVSDAIAPQYAYQNCGRY